MTLSDNGCRKPCRISLPAQSLVDRLDAHYSWIETHCEFVTCHGDLHMCNGVTRTAPPDGTVLLIDFAPCRQPAKGLSTRPDLDRLSKITLAWFAMVMWHMIPERRSNPAYCDLMRQYIEEGAQTLPHA